MSLVTKLFLCVLFGSVAAVAQQLPLSIGIKGGIPLTDFIGSGPVTQDDIHWSSLGSKNFIVGPTIELKLPLSLSIEADALYRPVDIANPNASTATRSLWEFPIVAKFHIPFPIITPYIEAGPSFRTRPRDLDYISNKGFTLGLGTDVHALFLRVSPEFRFTRWGEDNTKAPNYFLGTKKEQVEFLVGLTF